MNHKIKISWFVYYDIPGKVVFNARKKELFTYSSKAVDGYCKSLLFLCHCQLKKRAYLKLDIFWVFLGKYDKNIDKFLVLTELLVILFYSWGKNERKHYISCWKVYSHWMIV